MLKTSDIAQLTRTSFVASATQAYNGDSINSKLESKLPMADKPETRAVVRMSVHRIVKSIRYSSCALSRATKEPLVCWWKNITAN